MTVKQVSDQSVSTDSIVLGRKTVLLSSQSICSLCLCYVYVSENQFAISARSESTKQQRYMGTHPDSAGQPPHTAFEDPVEQPMKAVPLH